MTERITIRIVDARQSKQPNIFRMLAAWIILPGMLFWPGLLVDSAPMQWAGFVLFVLMTLVFLGRYGDEFKTAEEARDIIERIIIKQRFEEAVALGDEVPSKK